jgi:hypothetical protein
MAWAIVRSIKTLEHAEQIDAVVKQVDDLVTAQRQKGAPVAPMPHPPIS